MKHQVNLKKWSWLLAIAFASALDLTACQKTQEQPGQSQTTNTAQPPKAPEHPEHPK